MGVKIYIAPYLQEHTKNKATIEVRGRNVGECLDELVKEFPEMEKILFSEGRKLFPYMSIFLNLSDTYPEDLAKPVRDGDEISIAYIIAGG